MIKNNKNERTVVRNHKRVVWHTKQVNHIIMYVSLMGQMEPAIFPGDQFKLKIDWSHENIGKYQK